MSNEKKQYYLEQITHLFLKYGFKSVGVDDIAKELGISKKTLYQEFKDKNEIINEAVKRFVDNEEEHSLAACQQSENAIDEIISIAKVMSQKFDVIHTSVMFELEKYYPEAWKAIQNHKNQFVFSCIKNNLERGIKENLYRDNMNTNIIARLFVNKIELFTDSSVFGDERYSFGEIYLEMMRYHIRGIANENGRNYLKERIKQVKIDL